MNRRMLPTLVAAITAIMALLPATASAVEAVDALIPCRIGYSCPTTNLVGRVSSNPDYKGWGSVDANYCPPNLACTMVYRSTVPAYRWNGAGWVATTRAHNERVYIWPYGYGYSWTWTESTGWLAVKQGYLFYSQPRILFAATMG